MRILVRSPSRGQNANGNKRDDSVIDEAAEGIGENSYIFTNILKGSIHMVLPSLLSRLLLIAVMF